MDDDQRGLIVARARACVGARFRLQGRDPRFGLDCVGLAALALGVEAPSGYALRGGDPDAIAAQVAESGVVPIARDMAAAGDLVLIVAGPHQYHLAVLTEIGFVHADAGLRRVVETPGAPDGVLAVWRAEGA